MKMMLTIAGMAIMVAAGPAGATRTHYHFTGSVDAVFFAPGALDVPVGALAEIDVYADPALRTDVTAAANAAFGTHYTHLEAASLGSPLDSLSFFVHTSTPGDLVQLYRSDQLPWPDALGITAPYVLFNNGHFFGIGFAGVNHIAEAVFTAGASPEPFDFVGGDFRLGGPSFGGHFDYSNVAGVPEPASWALIIAGFGLTGAAMRRRRRPASVAASEVMP